jgi:glucose-1-phosphate thymidylyltransferase
MAHPQRPGDFGQRPKLAGLDGADLTAMLPRNSSEPAIVGLLPAAGSAVRISPIPCSKEIFPIGFHPSESVLGLRPKASAHYLLEKMHLAGAQRAYFILRDGKWDIPAYFGDGRMVGLPLGYLMMGHPYGVPYTIDQAYPFTEGATVLFGFPDILFQPGDAFVRLLNRRDETGADLVIGLFPADQPHKMDMVELDPRGRVAGITIKPHQTHLRFTWIIAVWGGRFSRFNHEFVASHKKIQSPEREPREIHLGDVIQAAIQKGEQVEHVLFNDGRYIDIGTPEDLMAAVQKPIQARLK